MLVEVAVYCGVWGGRKLFLVFWCEISIPLSHFGFVKIPQLLLWTLDQAIENAQKQQSEKKVPRKRKVKEPSTIQSGGIFEVSWIHWILPCQEPSIFDMPLPEHERVAVDLTKHLVANEKPPEVGLRLKVEK